MPRYKVTIQEIRVYEGTCIVEADNPESAKEAAASGDVISDEMSVEYMVEDRVPFVAVEAG